LVKARIAHLLMIFRIRVVSDLLEPCEAKVSSTVLRGGGGGDAPALPGGESSEHTAAEHGYQALALTDTNSLADAVEFAAAARRQGSRPSSAPACAGTGCA